jgi:signal transduction histidine kinase/PAS domain-containing protein
MQIGGNVLPEMKFEPLWLTFLSLIPFVINLITLLYVALKGARNKLNFNFLLFLLVLCAWQLAESLGRTAALAETAVFFIKFSLYLMILIPVFGTMFILRLSGQTSVMNSPIFFIIYFVSPVIICAILVTESYEFLVSPSDFFIWKSTPVNTISTLVFFAYIVVTCTGMLGFIWRAYLKADDYSNKFNQLTLMAWGFSIPVILGIVCEILLPVLTDSEAFPVNNISVLSFSLASIYAMFKTKLFRTVPKHEWKYLLDHVNDGILIINNNNVIRFANKKAARILECRNSNLKEYDLKVGFANSGIDIGNLSNYSGNGSSQEFDLTTFKNNSRRVKASFRSFVNRENANTESLIILTDLHHLRKAEQEAVLKSSQLSSFLYRTSHDLKNPVVCIEGLLNLYKEGSEEERAKCIDLIEISNNRIKTILHSMGEITRFNQHVTTLGEVSLNQLVQEIVSMLRAQNSPLSVISNFNSNITLHTDAVLIGFIFKELSMNAERFRRPLIKNPSIEIRHERTNTSDIITFTDNGIGIPQKFSGELFGIFFRGHEHSGTGMGLYSVKWICDKLGYTISHRRSSCGTNTQFVLTIPLAHANSMHITHQTSESDFEPQAISA